MTPGQYESVAIVLGMAALFVGVNIAKRGSAFLSDAQKASLQAMGPDHLAMLAPVAMVGAAYLSKQYAWPMIVVEVAALGMVLYRVPFRLAKMPWPIAARRNLVIGNCVLSGGMAAAALFYSSQYL
jgi:hypothetical protein